MESQPCGTQGPALTGVLTGALAGSGLPLVAAYLFGSCARSEAGPLSDVDVAVVFDEEIAPEARVAEAARLHMLLDRVSPRAVQLVVLNDAPPQSSA